MTSVSSITEVAMRTFSSSKPNHLTKTTLTLILLTTVIRPPFSNDLYGQLDHLGPVKTFSQEHNRAAGDPFTKITEGEIVSDSSALSTGCSWADFDNDGDLDLYSCNYGHNNYFYVNNGDGTFTKTTSTVIIHPGNSNAGIWADYDNDGDLDLIVANNGTYEDMESWFSNNGDGTFTQIVNDPIANDGGASQGVCWADYDNDGNLDLFVPNGFYGPKDNTLFHNNGNGTFTKITTGDVVSDGGTSRSASWADYDNDGDLDLHVSNEGFENDFFYINNGDGTFTKDSTSVITMDGRNSRGGNWGDYDNDGDLDLFVANNSGGNVLFQNDGNGSFIIDTSSVVSEKAASFNGIWFDYNNDGDLDLFVANHLGYDNFLYDNNGDGTFTKNTSSIVANDGGFSETCASGDYDNDGDLDLFVSNVTENNFLYRNNGNSNSWMNILCEGTVSNRSGIGATVRAKATINGNPVWQLRQVEAQGGYRNQNSLNVEFGFGDATIIDSLTIEWPSGILDVYTNVGVNQFMTAIEGQAIPAVGEGENDLPQEFDLNQNYPNPFNPSTIIKYSVSQTSHVTLKVYNVLAQEVATLVDEQQEAGEHEVHFEPAGKASGAYFYRLQAGKHIETKKLVLLR